MTVEELLRRGGESQAAGDLDGAEEAYREADELQDAEGAILLGVVLKLKGDLGGAEDAFQRAEARGHREAGSSLGNLLWERGDVAGAKAAYQRSVSAGSTGAVLNLGLLLAQEGPVDEALPHLRAAEETGFPEASWAIGKLLESRDDLWGAEAAYSRASEAGIADAAYGLGSVLLKFDEPSAARAAFQRAHELGHDGAGALVAVLDQQLSAAPSPTGKPAMSEPLADPTDVGGGLRTDGIYQCPQDGYSLFVRFTEDGQVFTASSTGSPRDVADWLNASSSTASRGNYSCAGELVEFSALSSEGAVNYNGHVLPDGDLVLDSYSHINGHSATGQRFAFVPV